MTKSNEPIWWSLFGAGGVVAAFFIPILLVVTGLVVPLGWAGDAPFAYERMHGAVAHPLTRLCLFVLIALPLWLAVAIAIKLDSSGPVFHRATRIGKRGRPFTLYKFRTMVADAPSRGPGITQEADPRITSVGRFLRRLKIDEMPQLINVLKGEMSFVGPRPERPEFVDELTNEIPFYDLRHRVNPGITGWAQICYPYGATRDDAKDKLEYDLYYIKNYSLFLDLMILIQTAQVVLWGKGAR